MPAIILEEVDPCPVSMIGSLIWKNGLKQAKALKQQQVTRERAAEKKRQRSDDTRRKILVGAVILAKVDHGEWPKERLREWMDKALTRADDRALFGMGSSSQPATRCKPLGVAASKSAKDRRERAGLRCSSAPVISTDSTAPALSWFCSMYDCGRVTINDPPERRNEAVNMAGSSFSFTRVKLLEGFATVNFLDFRFRAAVACARRMAQRAPARMDG
jgi:hypothetical protein